MECASPNVGESPWPAYENAAPLSPLKTPKEPPGSVSGTLVSENERPHTHTDTFARVHQVPRTLRRFAVAGDRRAFPKRDFSQSV